MAKVNKVIINFAMFLIGYVNTTNAYSQDDIKVGATHFTAPNSYLYEWRNTQKTVDYLTKDNQYLVTKSQVCENKVDSIKTTNQAVITRLQKKVSNRGKVSLIAWGAVVVETIILIVLVK